MEVLLLLLLLIGFVLVRVDLETYSRIGLVGSHGNLQSYWTSTKLWKYTVVLSRYEALETYGRISH